MFYESFGDRHGTTELSEYSRKMSKGCYKYVSSPNCDVPTR